MSELEERLYLAALASNWWLDWRRYYDAVERRRAARWNGL